MRTRDEVTDEFMDICKYLDFDVEVGDVLDMVNEGKTFDEITRELDDNRAFDTDVVYYCNAMEILSKYDNSLKLSLDLADEMGYKPKDLSSEILASLLMSDYNREKWIDLKGTLSEFLENRKEELEGEEE